MPKTRLPKARSLKIKTKSRTPFFLRRRIVLLVCLLVLISLSVYTFKYNTSARQIIILSGGSFKSVDSQKDLAEAGGADHGVLSSSPAAQSPGTDELEDDFHDEMADKQKAIDSYTRANGTFFSLARNEDLKGILQAIESVEERFNNKYHYDWIFANDQDFTKEFIQVTSSAVSGNPIYVKIPSEFWGYPSWIDQDLAADVRDQMEADHIKYGDLESYRHMCRFNSGFFFKLPELQKYKYYWRVEPEIRFNCDIDYDLFKYMEENKKVYGFAMAPYEIHTTVLSLWSVMRNFSSSYPQYIAKNNNLEFLTDDNGETFNMCHFWSNFEIGDMDFYRTQAYEDFFQYMDLSGGFYYERWGDAPVHTMAIALMLSRDQVHYVDNTGYYHSPNGQCPRDSAIRDKLSCDCDADYDYNWTPDSCIPLYYEINGMERPDAVKHTKGLKSHKDGSVNSNPIVKSGYQVIS